MRFRYPIVLATLLLILIGFVAQVGLAQDQSPPQNQSPTSVLFENVQIFDGTSEQLSASSNVLVVGNQIQTISTGSWRWEEH